MSCCFYPLEWRGAQVQHRCLCTLCSSTGQAWSNFCALLALLLHLDTCEEWGVTFYTRTCFCRMSYNKTMGERGPSLPLSKRRGAQKEGESTYEPVAPVSVVPWAASPRSVFNFVLPFPFDLKRVASTLGGERARERDDSPEMIHPRESMWIYAVWINAPGCAGSHQPVYWTPFLASLLLRKEGRGRDKRYEIG